jgi:hypothetical protein
MNSEEYHGMILEVFHEVCTNLFLCCKCHWWTILRNLLDVSVVSQHSRSVDGYSEGSVLPSKRVVLC